MHDAGELILFRDTENGFLSRLAQLRAACGADTFIQTKTSDTKQETRQLRLQCVSDYTALIRDIFRQSLAGLPDGDSGLQRECLLESL